MQQPFASFRRGRAQPDTQNAERIGVRLMPWGAVHALTDTHSHSFKLGTSRMAVQEGSVAPWSLTPAL